MGASDGLTYPSLVSVLVLPLFKGGITARWVFDSVALVVVLPVLPTTLRDLLLPTCPLSSGIVDKRASDQEGRCVGSSGATTTGLRSMFNEDGTEGCCCC